MLEAMGLIDSQQQKTFASYCARIVSAIKGKYMRLAFDIWDEMINGDVFPYGSLFLNMTGVYDYDNFENTRPPAAFALYSQVEAVVCAACVCPLLYACCDHTTTLTTRGRLPRVCWAKIISARRRRCAGGSIFRCGPSAAAPAARAALPAAPRPLISRVTSPSVSQRRARAAISATWLYGLRRLIWCKKPICRPSDRQFETFLQISRGAARCKTLK